MVPAAASWRLLHHRKRKEHLTAKESLVQAPRDIARAHHKSTSAAALLTVGYYLLLGAALVLAFSDA